MYRNLVNVIGAICLIGGSLGELIWSLVSPSLSGAPASEAVAAVKANPGAASAGLWIDLLILLLIPASLFLGRVLHSGARPLVGVGTGVLFVGSLVFVYALAGDVVLFAAAGTGSVSTAQAYLDSGVVALATLLGLVCQLAGFVILGIAALRSRFIPRWAGVLLIVWNVVQAVGTVAGITPVTIFGNALLVVAYVACAVRLFRPAEFEASVALAPESAH